MYRYGIKTVNTNRDIVMFKLLMVSLFYLNNYYCRDAYLLEVLKSNNLARYFIVVRAKIDNNEQDIVVINYYLHTLMKSRDSSFNDLNYYVKFMKKKIQENEPIEINKSEFVRIKAAIVEQDTSVAASAAKGKEYLLHKYFYVSDKYNYARLNPDVKNNQVAYIAKKLFNWNCFMAIVEGDIDVENLNFCDNYSDSSSNGIIDK